jgi:hypothetical protein
MVLKIYLSANLTFIVANFIKLKHFTFINKFNYHKFIRELNKINIIKLLILFILKYNYFFYNFSFNLYPSL